MPSLQDMMQRCSERSCKEQKAAPESMHFAKEQTKEGMDFAKEQTKEGPSELGLLQIWWSCVQDQMSSFAREIELLRHANAQLEDRQAQILQFVSKELGKMSELRQEVESMKDAIHPNGIKESKDSDENNDAKSLQRPSSVQRARVSATAARSSSALHRSQSPVQRACLIAPAARSSAALNRSQSPRRVPIVMES